MFFKMAQKYFTGGMNIIVVGDESVLSKIKQFDADGVIEKVDAFGKSGSRNGNSGHHSGSIDL